MLYNVCMPISEKLIKLMYGNNYLYRISEYQKTTDDGLPQYAVNFSEYPKWGINPKGGSFPNGIYFYFLTPKCFEYGGTGKGYFSNREYRNIAKLNLDRLAILKDGNERAFSRQDRLDALSLLRRKYGDGNVNENCYFKYYQREYDMYTSKSAREFAMLFDVLICMQISELSDVNSLLHFVGYDGILDIDGDFLPIEGCQGVQTWPGAATHIESIRSHKSIPYHPERLKNIMRGFRNIPDGSMKLSLYDFEDIVYHFRRLYNIESNSQLREDTIDFVRSLIVKMDLSDMNCEEPDELMSCFIDRNIDQLLFDSFESNPTTPKAFWKRLINSRFEDVRFTARDILGMKYG